VLQSGTMWLRAARKHFLSRGLTVALAAMVLGGALNWGHVGGDDPDCDPVLVHHDHNAHRFTAAPSTSSPQTDHCYLCHSLRLLQTSLVARGAHAVTAVHSTPFSPIEGLAAKSVFAVDLSSRAPPSASL
jgi:hypothetical protein